MDEPESDVGEPSHLRRHVAQRAARAIGDARRHQRSGLAESKYEGMRVDEAAKAGRQGSVRLRLRNADRRTRGIVGCVWFIIDESDLKLAMKQPWVSVGSDGSALATSGPLRTGVPHPRNFGTFPRVLGKYVREGR